MLKYYRSNRGKTSKELKVHTHFAKLKQWITLLPVIGHLHLFSGSNLPHKTFGLLAVKYGPIFTVKFGAHQALVVNDRKIAQDCFTTNDKALASRPKALAVELLGYNYAIFGLGPYGPYWREMKKIVVLELLSNHRVQIIEMKQWFENLAMTIIIRMLFGKEHDFEEGKRARNVMTIFFKLLGAFVVADFIPSLRWLDIEGYEKEMKKNAKEIDYILEKWLVEHKKKRSCGENKSEDDKDFMDIMLSLFEDAMDEDLAGFDADTIIKSTCLVSLL
ncbi:hypothetical protein H5410_024489 [Solanum commersonii]|uniref:Cytochrome P450 n=1 Tax=Solanum commersonii TaxID=4109 RepID=A0A9J5ZM58_SOLCO|nr:hypothetical protein H5410_024489 [Solanum commersonii]